MIEINEADDVVRAKTSGRLDRAELEQVTDLVERSLDARPKTHFLVEVQAFAGFDAVALADYLPRAAAMLGRLDRFGRIAVVSDQSWVRWATRLESALLPHVRYEVFEPAEREQALAWVEGRELLPHGRALRLIETDRPEVIGFELDGKLGVAELKAAALFFGVAMDRQVPLRVLGRVRRVEGVELAALVDRDFLSMKWRALDAIERYAIVGGPAWLRAWVEALATFQRSEIRWFPPEDESHAWQWLEAAPQRVRFLVE